MPATTFLIGNCRLVQALDLIPGKRDRTIKIQYLIEPLSRISSGLLPNAIKENNYTHTP